MTFQSTVRQLQTSGIIGETSNEGPLRVQPWNLDSSGSAQANTFGNVFSQLSDEQATVGNQGGVGTEQLFIGILVRPKEHT